MNFKNLILASFVFISFNIFSQEYKIITTVESIVPMGAGRSRMIESMEKVTVEDKTQVNTKEGKDKNKASRKEIKIDEYNETLLLNFYSGVGINFQNIASNDALISQKINDMVSDGWELVFVNSAAESDAGEKDGKGIFITRYIFKR
jgi:hypothetical protein